MIYTIFDNGEIYDIHDIIREGKNVFGGYKYKTSALIRIYKINDVEGMRLNFYLSKEKMSVESKLSKTYNIIKFKPMTHFTL